MTSVLDEFTVDWHNVKTPSQLTQEDKEKILNLCSSGTMGYPEALRLMEMPESLFAEWEESGRANPGGEHDLFFKELITAPRIATIRMLKTVKNAAVKSKKAKKSWESPEVQRWIKHYDIKPEELEG
ncbi:hypothetical protein [Methanomassiliicoccus luminyensis]|uniref:hypothetical protein n=1 Tax=Methanomassiliicoccus luminyensis TaxID=1080712 RepID=UPI00036F36B1|nr:hypothetical protein [Methanomassiliicoccus luminyensis]